MVLASALGAPRILIEPPTPARSIRAVRRDIAAFLGVAPRGPAHVLAEPLEDDDDVASWLSTRVPQRSVPVRVTSWDDYRRHFGSYEGPGRLPYAVSAFFNGVGAAADIIRVVHDHGDPTLDAAGRASGDFGVLTMRGGGPITLTARSEGSWGNRLAASLRFETRPVAFEVSAPDELVVSRGEWVPGGSLLRLILPGDVATLRYVESSTERNRPFAAGTDRVLRLEAAVAAVPEAVEVVTATLRVRDLDPLFDRAEMIGDLGLRFDHPRWLARAIVNESTLLWPDAVWAGGTVDLTDATLPDAALVGADDAPTMQGGEDRWSSIVPDDFFDAAWITGDERAGAGVHALAHRDDVGLLLAPDLYEPEPLAPVDDVADPPSLCGPTFTVHEAIAPVAPPSVPLDGLSGLALDPLDSVDRARILASQRALVDYAAQRRDLTVLLDVPPRLSQHRILTWRTEFDSEFAAGYHPWIDVATRDDRRDSLVRVNPSAFAAAVIARRERRRGVHVGPANQPAVGAVRVADVVTTDEHDALHLAGVNVFVPMRDAVELTGARTLARRPALCQLSVARLMTVLRLTLAREMQWAVFEPNNRALWGEVRRLVHTLLTRYHEMGAFAGATTKESFFVRCDRSTMTQNDLDNGRIVCLVGVAPVEPIEYLVLRLALARESGVDVSLATA
ncbi:MAG: phage tail sheath C-terminal domain-containing protein [Actinomycetota bacterium]